MLFFFFFFNQQLIYVSKPDQEVYYNNTNTNNNVLIKLIRQSHLRGVLVRDKIKKKEKEKDRGVYNLSRGRVLENLIIKYSDYCNNMLLFIRICVRKDNIFEIQNFF